VGDIKDDHWYDVPDCSGATEDRVNVLGEIGGLRMYVPDHSWNSDDSSGGDPLSISRMANGTQLAVRTSFPPASCYCGMSSNMSSWLFP
jgi:hypothetical protein